MGSVQRKFTLVSLFSGGMGLDLGLERAGFATRLAADNMPAAVATIRKNRPGLLVLDTDARKLTGDLILRHAGLAEGKLDLLSGGPPCQSFSTAGKRLSVDDSNGPLVFEFVRLLGEIRPAAFLMENVKGLLSAPIKYKKLPPDNNGMRIKGHHGTLLVELLRRIKDLGYSVDYRELNAADYGVPQVRLRVFICGYRDGRTPGFPAPTHAQGPHLFLTPWRTIREVLHDLKDDSSPRNQFSPRKLSYLRHIPPGGNWRDLPEELQRESMGKAFYAKGGRCGWWRRLSFDKPAPTILTEPQNAGTALCHPTEDRPLTVRECARIQTFPDDWQFCGRTGDQYRLVGNAVPPLLGEAVGVEVYAALSTPPRHRGRHKAVTC